MKVAEGFFKRATGYAYTETTFEKIDDKATLERKPVLRKVCLHFWTSPVKALKTWSADTG